MKLKIAVCDDDVSQREYLAGIVTGWAEKKRYLAQVRQYARAEEFLFDYAEEKDFDILLLDVEMPGMSGVELAKKIRSGNAVLQIIFITGYYEYFSDGYDVSALHYLLKPVDGERLVPVLNKAADRLACGQRFVLLEEDGESVKAALSDILYVESENVYIIVHTLQRTFRMRMALGKFTERLDETFFRVHRSYVVNLRYIKKITRTDIFMENGDRIPISRGMYGEVYASLIKYL